MSICTTVVKSYDARELARAYSIGYTSFEGTITTTLQIYIGVYSILLHLTGYDVYHTTHSIWSIDHRGRTTKNFNLLCQHGLISICNRMAIETCILWKSIYQYQKIGIRTNTTYFDTSSSASTYTITQDTTACNKESWYLLGYSRQNIALIICCEFLLS